MYETSLKILTIPIMESIVFIFLVYLFLNQTDEEIFVMFVLVEL